MLVCVKICKVLEKQQEEGSSTLCLYALVDLE